MWARSQRSIEITSGRSLRPSCIDLNSCACFSPSSILRKLRHGLHSCQTQHQLLQCALRHSLFDGDGERRRQRRGLN